MKLTRSSESVRLRRDLAQLLRRLRAARKEKLSCDELASRITLAIIEARSVSRLIRFAGGAMAPPAGASYDESGQGVEGSRARLDSHIVLSTTTTTH